MFRRRGSRRDAPLPVPLVERIGEPAPVWADIGEPRQHMSTGRPAQRVPGPNTRWRPGEHSVNHAPTEVGRGFAREIEGAGDVVGVDEDFDAAHADKPDRIGDAVRVPGANLGRSGLRDRGQHGGAHFDRREQLIVGQAREEQLNVASRSGEATAFDRLGRDLGRVAVARELGVNDGKAARPVQTSGQSLPVGAGDRAQGRGAECGGGAHISRLKCNCHLDLSVRRCLPADNVTRRMSIGLSPHIRCLAPEVSTHPTLIKRRLHHS